MTQLEIFKNPLSKADQFDLADGLIQQILNGEINVVKAEIYLKAMENIIDAVRKNRQVKTATMEETLKHGKSFEMDGAEIENCSRTTYDYSQCGDAVYNNLIAEQERIKEQIKIREAIIKSGVDASTGECFNPPQSKTTEYLKIVFK